MAYLFDSVAILCWWTEPDRLGRKARAAIADGEAQLYMSPVSVWEIANKNRIGKLDAMRDFQGECAELMVRDGIALLDIKADHAMRAGYLPGAHRDPFDRLIAGQALVEDLTVLTNDSEIAAFGCKVLW